MNTSIDSTLTGNETILVVDDHECLRDVARVILERCGYRVLTASNGMEAVAVARSHAGIDLLLTDIEMPRMRGDELAAWFRDHRPWVQIVFTSSDPGRLNSLLPAWIVAKPFIHIDVLIKTIREALTHGHAATLTAQLAA